VRLAAASALLAIAAAPLARAVEPGRLEVSTTFAVTRWSAAREPFVGGRLAARGGPLVLSASVDGVVSDSRRQPHLSWAALLGAGLTRELAPDLTIEGLAVVGECAFQIRDVVNGGFLPVHEPGIGGRVGVELRFASSLLLGVTPVAGVSTTVLYVRRGSDRLREVDWGGPMANVSMTLGLEFGAPRRREVPPPPGSVGDR
jgi:hypothetical protein